MGRISMYKSGSLWMSRMASSLEVVGEVLDIAAMATNENSVMS